MLGHEWEPAQGVCIDVRFGRHQGNAAVTANSVHYLMEVRPATGEPFRTEVEPPALMLSFKGPHPGQTVRMECQPGRQKARFDRDDPSLSTKTENRLMHEIYEEERRAPVRPAPPSGT
jgi:hypothetical protein